jgi:hypothetical protein
MRYDRYFDEEKYGLIRREHRAHIINDMGFKIEGDSEGFNDYKSVKECFDSGLLVIVISRISLVKGSEGSDPVI